MVPVARNPLAVHQAPRGSRGGQLRESNGGHGRHRFLPPDNVRHGHTAGDILMNANKRIKNTVRRMTMSASIRLGLVAGFIGVLGMTGCKSILDVSVPGNIEEARLDDPALADLMTRSVISAW